MIYILQDIHRSITNQYNYHLINKYFFSFQFGWATLQVQLGLSLNCLAIQHRRYQMITSN